MTLWVVPIDRICGLVVKVPGYRTEMQCISCEVQTEFIYVMQKKVDRLCGLVVRFPRFRFRFASRHYQIFWEVVGLERGPLSLMSTSEELLERRSSGSGLENREYGSREPARWPRGTLCPQNLALSSPTDGGRLVQIGPRAHPASYPMGTVDTYPGGGMTLTTQFHLLPKSWISGATPQLLHTY
jgi:hypothetical protein